jgi:predicted Zn-dependent protease
MVLVPELRRFDQIAGLGMQLLFLKFGRDDERQSDELGVEYMTQLGYDPAELADVFGLLERKSQAEGGALPSWASTHPQPGERQSTILALAEQYPAARTVERDAYLTRLDGLVFGDDPRNGFFRDGWFHHPELTFRFALPRGWQGLNGDRSVQLMGPDQDVIMVLQLADASDPRAAAEQFAAQDGVRVQGTRSASIHGLDAFWVDFSVETGEGTLAGRAAFPRVEGRVYAFYGFSAASRWSGHQSAVTDVLGSFQRETDPAVLAVTPDRIDVLSLDHALSVRDFVREYQVATDAATVALINQVWDTERLEPGWVKRVVS